MSLERKKINLRRKNGLKKNSTWIIFLYKSLATNFCLATNFILFFDPSFHCRNIIFFLSWLDTTVLKGNPTTIAQFDNNLI